MYYIYYSIDKDQICTSS